MLNGQVLLFNVLRIALTVILIAFQDSYFKIVVYAVLFCLKCLKLLELRFDFSGNTHNISAYHSCQMKGDSINTAGINKEE